MSHGVRCNVASLSYTQLFTLSLCLKKNYSLPLLPPKYETVFMQVQGAPLPTKPGISLIILKPMKILQRDLNRSTFVV